MTPGGAASANRRNTNRRRRTRREAEYCDDVPKPAGTLHAALVLSTVAHADVIAVDSAAALAMPGVRGYFDHRDVPVNDIGPAVIDEEVFASRRVTCVGHQIGIVVADTREQALDAARAVKVTYAELPAVFTIEEAVAAGSFHEHEGFTDHEIVDGDPDGAMAACEAGAAVRGVAGAADRTLPRTDGESRVVRITTNW